MIPTRTLHQTALLTHEWDTASRTPLNRNAILLDRLTFWALTAFVGSIAWSETLPRFGDFVLVRWLGILAGLAGLLQVAVNGRMRRLVPAHYALSAFVAWAGASLLWTMDWDGSLTRLGTYAQLLFATWLIWEFTTTQERVERLMQAYLLGTCFAALNTIYNFALGKTAAQLAVNADNHLLYSGTRFTTEGLNANDLGLMLALSIPLTLYLMVQARKGWMAALYWIALGSCLTAQLLTASRGAMISAGVGFLMFPFAWRRLPLGQRTFSLVAMAATAVGALLVIPPAVWRRLGSTATMIWSSLTENGTLTHRVELWRAGWEAFEKHSLLGVGAGAYGQAILRMIDIPYVAHNTFLSVLVELGVIGALVLAGILLMLGMTAWRMPKLQAALWLTVLATWSVGVSALTWEYRKPTWFLFGLLLAHAAVKRPRLVRSQSDR